MWQNSLFLIMIGKNSGLALFYLCAQILFLQRISAAGTSVNDELPPNAEPNIYKLQDGDTGENLQLASLFSKFDSYAPISVTKCCQLGQVFSLDKKRCVPMEPGESGWSQAYEKLRLSSDWSGEFVDVSVRLPCNVSASKSAYDYSRLSSVVLHELFENGYLIPLACGDQLTSTHFAPNQYCFDTDEYRNPILLLCQECQPELDIDIGVKTFLYYFFWTSILLVVSTFFIHLTIPELRRTVHQKCFLCYLAFLLSTLLNFFFAFASYDPKNRSNWKAYIFFILGTYTFLSTFFWLNAMCIHLWRVLTTVHPISGRSFRTYAWYALGLPLICIVVISIYGIARIDEIHKLIRDNSYDSPTYMSVHTLTFLQIINLLVFFRVGFILWYQKQEPGTADSKRHNAGQKSIFSQLFRLFVITGLDWINVIVFLYALEKAPLSIVIFSIFNICPGYLIFTMFVIYDKNVRSALKKQFFSAIQ